MKIFFSIDMKLQIEYLPRVIWIFQTVQNESCQTQTLSFFRPHLLQISVY